MSLFHPLQSFYYGINIHMYLQFFINEAIIRRLFPFTTFRIVAKLQKVIVFY
jgi:hypothetical protein